MARGRKISWKHCGKHCAQSGSRISFNTMRDEPREVCSLPRSPFASGYTHRALGNIMCGNREVSQRADVTKGFNLWAAGWHFERCYLTPQAGPRLSLHFLPWKKAASGKDPLCSGLAAYCNTLVWQRRLQRPCSCPGQQPGALAEGASSRVQVFYESQACTRGLMPSSVCSWFYQLPF